MSIGFDMFETRLVGRLVRDPELSYTPKGRAVVKFTIPVDRSWKEENGTKHEKTLWIECKAWGNSAENIAKYFTKGKPIAVLGEVSSECWLSKKTGEPDSKVVLTVKDWGFLPSDTSDRAKNGGSRRAASDNDDDLFTDPDEDHAGEEGDPSEYFD